MPLRLLLVENSKADAKLIVHELRKEGLDLDFVRVNTPQDLEAALDENNWDAVIADYGIPEFTGLEALRIIHDKGLDLPFILVSGSIGEKKAVDAMRAGAHDFILKGDFSRLVPALERELRQANVRRERRQALEKLSCAHDELEARVRQRTAELEQANEACRAEVVLRTQAMESLHNYAQRLTVLEETMRRKLATELHDELGRNLTVLGLNFNIVSNSLSQNAREKLGERISDSITMLEEMGRKVRSMMTMLRPPLLDEYGLVAALRSHADRFAKRAGIAADTQLEEIEPRLSDELELAFFRIAQEAMANVSKHAEATCVTLKLGRYEGGVRLSISDDGRGFDPCRNKPSDSGAGWGLAIMRERAESVRARFSLDSRPGRGTVLSVETGEE